MLALLVLILILVLLGGGGFALHALWLVGIVALIVWAVLFLARRGPRV